MAGYLALLNYTKNKIYEKYVSSKPVTIIILLYNYPKLDAIQLPKILHGIFSFHNWFVA